MKPSCVRILLIANLVGFLLDGSAFDCAQVHEFKLRKVSKNMRIFQSREEVEKTIGGSLWPSRSRVN
jgi:hypothetical protein